MHIITQHRDILDILYKFFPKLTKAQLKRVNDMEDDLVLTTFLISAYNVFEITHHVERCCMITNPQALIITAVETQELLKIVKEYAFDTIAKNNDEDVLERKGKKDGSSDRL